MEYRQLGSSGLQVSEIGLGTNNFGHRDQPPFHIRADAAAEIVNRALDVGINLIDTANSYGEGLSEEFIGRALKGRREQAVIATKVSTRVADGPNLGGNSRKHIVQEVEKSLRRLDTDYIDLYQIHWVDPNTPIEETLSVLDDLVHQGKVRYIGCSNFKAWQVCEAVWTSRSMGITSFVSVQPRYNMLDRAIEDELLPFCEQYHVGVLPYFPLANGFLTGKYRRDQSPAEGTRLAAGDRGMLTEDKFDTLERLETFAAEREHSILELAFAWLLARPSVSSVIAGASRPEQVASNAEAAGWRLTADDMAEIDTLLARG
jgi:aryl-alcohol dehydrogenase-like predicted oxidoreductase